MLFKNFLKSLESFCTLLDVVFAVPLKEVSALFMDHPDALTFSKINAERITVRELKAYIVSSEAD